MDYLNEIKDFNPNFIFINGALHHLDDTTVKNINKFQTYLLIVISFLLIRLNQK